MKVCTQRGERKSLDDFYLQKRRSGTKAPMSHCKVCHNSKVAARVQSMSPAQREHHRSDVGTSGPPEVRNHRRGVRPDVCGSGRSLQDL